MKKYINVIYIAILLTSIVACSKDFLEKEALGKIDEETFYKTEKDAMEALVAAYSLLYGDWTDLINQEVMSDNSVTGAANATDGWDIRELEQFRATSTNPKVKDIWSKNFTGISRANIVIEKVPDIAFEDEDEKDNIIAEAKFLRAFYYFNLVLYFGDVPMITKILTENEIIQERVNKNIIYEKVIIPDLEAAIPNLETTHDTRYEGRVTQGTAQALLGKVHLFNENFTDAAKYLKDAINSPAGFELEENFEDIFSSENQNNKETLFAVQHTSKEATNDWGSPKGNMFTTFAGIRDYKGDTYAEGWGFNLPTQDLVDAFEAGDVRLAASIISTDTINDDDYTKSNQHTGYYTQKYAPLLKDKAIDGGDPFLNYPTNKILMRLADVYLMYAEAVVNGGDGGDAQQYFDAVYKRARGEAATPPVVSLPEIKKERRLELALEGIRFFDLVRWDDASTVLEYKGFAKGKHELLPIPQNEIDRTNGVITQNPGY